MPNEFFNDSDFWGVIRFNGVEFLGDGTGGGGIYGMAIARMRGAGSDDSGVITATGDLTETDLKVVAQASPNMTVKVNAGVCIVEGMFTGISSAVDIAITAPTTNNRITIIQISQAGEVTKKDGTEAGSPVAPDPDANNYKLGQVLCTVAMTDIENTDCTDSRTTI